MSSSTRHEPPILDAPADLLTMAVTRSDESPAPTPAWTTIEQVFTALESPLLIYARRLVGDFNVAEDIVQEAFMKLHTQFQSVAAPQPWLYRTVHNLAVDHQRRASRITLVGNSSDDETNPSPINEASDAQPLPDEQIARWEGIGLVRLVLETLDERSRELIRLRFHEELSYKEIAARTGCRWGMWATCCIMRSRRWLRSWKERRWGDDAESCPDPGGRTGDAGHGVAVGRTFARGSGGAGEADRSRS